VTTSSTSVETIHFDMYDRELYASPYAMYRRLRDEAPLYHNEEYGFFAVSRYEDAAQVLVDRDTFISGKGSVYQIAAAGIDMPDGLFIFEDPPLHAIHRALVARLFTPRAISRLEPQIVQLFEASAEALVGRTEFDFVSDFATMLPIRVIGMLLGLPERDHAELRATFHKSQNENTASEQHESFSGTRSVAHLFNDYLDFRQANPTDDLMTELLNVEFEDAGGTRRKLRREELLTFLTLIAAAGSDTTVNALAWTGMLLGEHPDQRRRLVDDPSLAANAVEEILRYEPPSYHIARTVAAEVEIRGRTLAPGAIVVTLPGAANRDERQHDDPENFDVTRRSGQQLTFSFGPHFCLGASLARLETRIALQAFLARFPNWNVDRQASEMTKGIDTRGWDSIPVTV
jgi:cytochrome P450